MDCSKVNFMSSVLGCCMSRRFSHKSVNIAMYVMVVTTKHSSFICYVTSRGFFGINVSFSYDQPGCLSSATEDGEAEVHDIAEIS